jgi:cation diffusion facilitator family transporter
MRRYNGRMQIPSLERFVHEHEAPSLADHERRTRVVVLITALTMVAELAAGALTGSMALLADGWHMASHAGALGLSLGAYWFVRRRARDAAFSFGPGKIYALAGYTSAVALAIMATWMLVESAARLWRPQRIAFDAALAVAVLGLAVNVACVRILHPRDHTHAHEHHHGHHDHARHQDFALRGAYLHVLADALTSVLAILALLGGRSLGWAFLDPVMGLVGGALVMRWSARLIGSAGRQLLDVVPSAVELERIRARLEGDDDARVADLHLWDLGPGRRACIASVVARHPRSAEHYRRLVLDVASISHLTVEVHAWPSDGCA